MACRAWAWFLPKFPVIFFPTEIFSAGFFWPPSNQVVLLAVGLALVIFLAGIGEDSVSLYMAFMYLFTVLLFFGQDMQNKPDGSLCALSVV